MFEIYDTDTNDVVARFHESPYRYTTKGDVPMVVEDALRTVRESGQMNRTQFDTQPAFEGNDGPIGNRPTSMETYQDAGGAFVPSRINQLVGPGYGLRDLDGADRVEAMRALLEAAFTEGDTVTTPDGTGVVVEIRTEPFEGPDGDVDASDDKPAYVVGTQDGAAVYRESDLSTGDFDTDVDDPAGDLQNDAEAMTAHVPSDVEPFVEGTLSAVDATVTGEASVTDFSYPDSWEESSTPNRIILLQAWASMGGQFDCGGGCCVGEMTGHVRSPDAFCAAMKDRVLLWEGWR